MKLYEEYSNFVSGVDLAFFVILGIAFFFLISITITIVVFVLKYRKSKNPVPTQYKDNYTLEIVWTVIPFLLVMLMFYYGYMGYAPMRDAPEDSYIIKAEGRMWEFEFTYPNGKTSKNLHIPVGKPVKLLMSSPDVIHGLYIPKFRVKEDMVPGKETYMWFIAQKEGTFQIYCTEYCGISHYAMIADAVVMNEGKFENWVADFNPEKIDNQRGLELLKKNACLACHAITAEKKVGPGFGGIFGIKRKVKQDGEMVEVLVDEEYLRKAIYEPNAQVVEGYAPNMMQSYTDVITPAETDTIIEYLKTLK